jgi:hypothetical protein
MASGPVVGKRRPPRGRQEKAIAQSPGEELGLGVGLILVQLESHWHITEVLFELESLAWGRDRSFRGVEAGLSKGPEAHQA